MLIQSNALFLLAPNYPLLSCIRDQGDAITYFNSYTDIHNKGVFSFQENVKRVIIGILYIYYVKLDNEVNLVLQ